jgi:hypothetical protein
MCGDDENGKTKCNPEVLAKLKKMEDEVQKESNSYWKGVDQFKDLDN